VSPRRLVITSVAAERDAVLRGLAGGSGAGISTVEVGGVGMASAAATTARLLATGKFDVVICAGIAGGFADRAAIGATVLASASVAAELGAESADTFIPLAELGFGPSTMDADAAVLAALRAALPAAVVGDVLTVATVTGTAERAAQLRQRCPGAVAEAMEGFGVATAAGQAHVPFAELRTISNPVGPRERGAWRLPEALAALERAATVLASLAW
jgi:futalosine hydrolase